MALSMNRGGNFSTGRRGATALQRCVARFTLGAFWGSLLMSSAVMTYVPAPAQANVDPLYIIKQQIKKPNILIALDTSASLTGAPGLPAGRVVQSFETNPEPIPDAKPNIWENDELGVDCDRGVNCRLKKMCSNDNSISCSTCMDCETNKKCQITSGVCSKDADCPVLPKGKCAEGDSRYWSGGDVVIPRPDCDVDGEPQCLEEQGGVRWGRCNLSRAILCQSDATCGAPTSWCGDKFCGGAGGKSCSSDADCGGADQARSSCVPVCRNTNLCLYSPPQCIHNTCGSDTCAATCIPDPGKTWGMCDKSLSVCLQDADCPAGEVCDHKPTSRAVMAKRVIGNVINETYNTVNFGLMTYYQAGYFPYYNVTNANSVDTTSFFLKAKLDDAKCWTKKSGPSSSCTLDGTAYARLSGADSRYDVYLPNGSIVSADQSWCGAKCRTPNGTGNFAGGYYVAKVNSGTVIAAKVVQASYQGKSITVGGTPYRYLDVPPDYVTLPVQSPWLVDLTSDSCDVSRVCSATCGGLVVQEIDPQADPAKARKNAIAIIDRMAPASLGGLVALGATPTGCMMDNTGAPGNRTRGASAYMSELKTRDTVPSTGATPCRSNFVMLVTDGEPNGPGDADIVNGQYISRCSTAACGAGSGDPNFNPVAAGCTCASVLAAYNLRKSQNVMTFAIGFAGDAATPSARMSLDNIARAGGTDANAAIRATTPGAPWAYLASNDKELRSRMLTAIFMAVQGSYTTSPATASTGVQDANGITAGQLALESRVDYPSWRGHLIAYDMSSATPQLPVWDATTRIEDAIAKGQAGQSAAAFGLVDWWERRVYVGGTDGSVVRVKVDATTKKVTNAAVLNGAPYDIGASVAEADLIMRWALGDPLLKNPAVLGAIVNSTPIDVGQPPLSWMPGGVDFYNTYKNRPSLTYIGSDDGMLHAFFSKDTTVAGRVYKGGVEAFAYIAPDMTSVVTNIYAQAGQSANPDDHIYGLANSPKVKNFCIKGSGTCVGTDWRTALVMPEGRGGNDMFTLDISNPVSTTAFSDPPVSQMWHTEFPALKATYDTALGETSSVPAFYTNVTVVGTDHRLIFASGYQTESASDPQGLQVVVASASAGTVLDKAQVSRVGNCLLPDGSTPRPYGLLTDTATAKNFTTWTQPLLAAYVGDTWGNLWRYRPGASGTPGSIGASPIEAFGCTKPLHYAPTVIQLDRDDPGNQSRIVFLAQVTNSTLDYDTKDLAASELSIIKESADVNGVFTRDTTFGTGGKKTLTVGTTAVCVKTDVNGNCVVGMATSGTQGGGGGLLPVTARPTSTPLGILKKDGYGFQVLTLWYVPDPSGCKKGDTYLTIHEVASAGTVTQKQGLWVASEPVTSPVVAGAKVFVISSAGATKIDTQLTTKFKIGGATEGLDGINKDKRFRTLNWTEK